MERDREERPLTQHTFLRSNTVTSPSECRQHSYNDYVHILISLSLSLFLSMPTFEERYIWTTKLVDVKDMTSNDIIRIRDRSRLAHLAYTTHAWSDLEFYHHVDVSSYYSELIAYLDTEQGKHQLSVYKAASLLKLSPQTWDECENQFYAKCHEYLSDPNSRDDYSKLFLTSILSKKEVAWYSQHFDVSTLEPLSDVSRVQCINNCHLINTLILLPFLRTKYPNILHAESGRHTVCFDTASKTVFDLSGFPPRAYEELYQKTCSFGARSYERVVEFVHEERWLVNDPSKFVATHGALIPAA